ncbi:MAG: hypothetical protein AAFX65_09380 [Cyanobacteria bacterium J06638_7]
MVGKVLTGNGITRCERGTYALVGGEQLSDAERDQLLELCRQRLDAFRSRTLISGSIKVRVLTRARGRFEGCGPGCCSASPGPAGPGSGPHRAQEPRRFRRPQKPPGPPLPLQCRQWIHW